jgi:predicted transcriptional regulator
VADIDVLSFVAGSIHSVWALELLILLKRCAPEGRLEAELVRELRSSATAVSESLRQLHQAGLIVEDAETHYYRPASAAMNELVIETENLYSVKPASVIKTIIASKNHNLQTFADSFKLKE